MLEKYSHTDSDQYDTARELRIAAKKNPQFFAEKKARQADDKRNKSNYYGWQQGRPSDYGEAHSDGERVNARRDCE